MSTSAPTEINVISLNCWGLKYLSALHNERLAEIGARIAAGDPVPHIVGLQECWTQEDYQAIRGKTRHILPYGKFYHSGIFGGGLVILSKWPIEESSMYRYPLNGRPTAFYRGDWFVGKGVACAKIRYGAGAKDVVEVFTTHVSVALAQPGFNSKNGDSSFMHLTNENRMILTSVTALPRHGK
jgi:sphingomyelin phosphodiesterase 2